MPVPLALALAPAFLGAAQFAGGAMMRTPDRPDYQIPQEIRQMLALRQAQARGRAPGASQMERNLFQSRANTIGAMQRMSSNPSAILAGVAASQGQMNRGIQSLQMYEAQDQERRTQGLEQAQRTMAGFRDKWGRDGRIDATIFFCKTI